MKKFSIILLVCLGLVQTRAQEILADVVVNAQQISGSNVQVYQQLEKNLRDFINNTSWTGRRLQNFEKIKANFAMVIKERNGNRYKGSLVVQSVRPVYGSTYESPMLNINDTNVEFEYIENENLVFNERQFSGKNLIDLISFYVFYILGTDGDSYQQNGGQEAFQTALKIANNAQNQGYGGWNTTEGPRTRGALINNILAANSSVFRNAVYFYHLKGLDTLSNTAEQNKNKKTIADALLSLQQYENSVQLNYPISVFLDTKADEIYKLFSTGDNSFVKITDLRQLMNQIAPKSAESRWNKWK